MNFERAKETYRKNAVVQKQMAKVLVSKTADFFGNKFDKIFEIGSGTGFLTEKISKNFEYKELFLNDITENFTEIEPSKYIKGDILDVEIPNNLDLIISNAAFQWIEDYNLLFKKLKNSLIKEGALCFSTFGANNFSQIKDITGIGLSYPDLSDVIKENGFEILYYEEGLQTLYFKNLKDVLLHIKFTGVKTENKIWTRKDYKNFEEKYLEKYKDNLGFELTYHPCFYILKKGS